MHWGVWWWKVSLGGIHQGSLLAWVSGRIYIALLEVPGLQGHLNRVHFRIGWVVSFSDWNFPDGLCWWHEFIARNCQIVHHWVRLWDGNPSTDRVRRDSQGHVCLFGVKQGVGISGHTFVGLLLLELVKIRWEEVSDVEFKFHYCIYI